MLGFVIKFLINNRYFFTKALILLVFSVYIMHTQIKLGSFKVENNRLRDTVDQLSNSVKFHQELIKQSKFEKESLKKKIALKAKLKKIKPCKIPNYSKIKKFELVDLND